MNRSAFFAAVRNAPFGGSLNQSQVDGLTSILDEWEKRGGGDQRDLSYELATGFHETAQTMQPIREYGKGKGHPYGKPGKHGGQIAYGRGLVQLTWDYNYAKADAELGLNGALTGNYELALRPDIAAAIMFGGMEKGWFTGKKLSDYIGPGKCDYRNARRIINGLDKANLIAGYASEFEAAMIKAVDLPQSASPVVPDAPAVVRPPPDPAATAAPPQPAPNPAGFSLWAAIRRWLGL